MGGRQAMYRPHRRRSEALRPAWVRLIKEVDPSQPEPVQVRGPQDAVNLLRERAGRELIEVFYVIALNSQARGDPLKPHGHAHWFTSPPCRWTRVHSRLST